MSCCLARGARLHLNSSSGLRGKVICSSLLIWTTFYVFAQPSQEDWTSRIENLKKLPLEALIDQPVTTVSRQPERWFVTPSAIQVISGEDILRSGALTLPEALRLAPNLQVAQQNAYSWAISARGFNGAPLANNSLADKLLVMIDGRSVYTPLFGGVFWDAQNVLLEDIDRIEVVSGPGASLWGANAVNGVINIISKNAKDTQGLYLSGAGGTFMQDFGGVRYGDHVGTNLFYRVYGQRFDHSDSQLPNGHDAGDFWDTTQGGFRMDYYPSDKDALTLQGDFYSGTQGGQPAIEEIDGQNVLTRWTRTLFQDSDITAQFYFDRTWRKLPALGFANELNTYDFDLQHRIPMGERNHFIWGAGFRYMQDQTRNIPALSLSPAHRDLRLFSLFAQDEIAVVPRYLTFTVGAKLEHNDYSGLEAQPSGRLAWTPSPRQTIWGAISRAVRSPARFDADTRTPFILGNSDFQSEKLTAYELGYRVRPARILSLSLAPFFNQYEDLRSINANTAVRPVTPYVFANSQHGETWGAELSGTLQARPWWRLRGGYTYLGEDIRASSSKVLPGSDTFEANDPQNQFLLQSMMDLPAHLQFDTVARYADTLANPHVPAYFTFDVRVAWRFKRFEISVVGRNLWDESHPEFGANEIPRSVYGKVTWRF